LPLEFMKKGFRKNATPTVLYTMRVENGRPVAEWVSENIKDVTGYSIEQVIVPGWWTRQIHPEDRTVESDADEELLNKGYLSYEYRFRFADGQYRWIRDEMRVIEDPDGCKIIFGAWRDVTPLFEAQQALLERDQLLQKLTQRVPGMLYKFELLPDGSMTFPYASEGIRDIYGVSPEQAAENAYSVQSSIHPDDFEGMLQTISDSAEQMCVWKYEYRVKGGADSWRWVRGEASPEKQKNGSIIWYGYISDISAAKNAERELTLAASVFEHAHDAIMITDKNAQILQVNPGFERMSGYSSEEVVGHKPSLLASGTHDEQFYEKLWKSLANREHWKGEVWNKTKSGKLYCERKTISTIRNAAGEVEYYIGIGTDVTAEKEQRQRMERLAHYDLLTDLPNRALLNDRICMAIENAKRSQTGVTLLFLDLDDFKPVNDQYGHATGDKLLQTIAQKLIKNVRSSDTVARLGGDEFVLLLGQDSAAYFKQLTERLLKIVGESVNVDGQKLQVTPSIGIAHFPEDADDADRLIRCADQAMYEAKRRGRNCAVTFAEIEA